MASTLTRNLLHITYSTKDRLPLITPSCEPDLYAYIGGICRDKGSKLLAMGGTSDHVHMLLSLAKTISLADQMMHVKRDASKWLKEHVSRTFSWQDGYFAFSLGESGVAPLTHYIAHPKEHHRSQGFQDEVRGILRENNMEWDERYIWS